LVDESHTEAYQTLITQFRDPIQTSSLSLENKPTKIALNDEIDAGSLRQRWSQIKDVHEGGQIINAFNSPRIKIYEALGDEYAKKLPYSIIEDTLKALSEYQIPTMIFVQNQSAVQSYAGHIKRLLRTGPWFNILDEGFNLHLNTEQIGQAWLITKPSENGYIHSLNVFDHNHNEIMIMTDNRTRGEQESIEWATLMKTYG
jgi:putative hemin transport protein